MNAYPDLLDEMMDAILAKDATYARRLYRDNKHFPPERRLAVYVEGYRLRLMEVIEATYPALRFHLGENVFREKSVEFIEATPSRHFNLDRYPVTFADYLAHSLPAPDLTDDFACDLAQLESAIHAVYQGEETPALAPEQAAKQPPEALAAAQLHPRAASRLLALSYPVNDYVNAFREGKNPVKPPPQQNWLLVLRHRHQVKRFALAQAEYTLLSLLAAGKTLEQALDDTRFALFAQNEKISADLTQWFARWVQEGVLRQP